MLEAFFIRLSHSMQSVNLRGKNRNALTINYCRSQKKGRWRKKNWVEEARKTNCSILQQQAKDINSRGEWNWIKNWHVSRNNRRLREKTKQNQGYAAMKQTQSGNLILSEQLSTVEEEDLRRGKYMNLQWYL